MELRLDVLGAEQDPVVFEYDWKAVATYALGVGAGPDALHYTWEGAEGFRPVPSFAVVPTTTLVMKALGAIGADFRRLVHGSQSVRWLRPLPAMGQLKTTGRVSAVHDKGEGAVVVIDTETTDADGPLFESTWSIFCRGQGGFGGERGAASTLPEPAGDPVLGQSMSTRPDQALVYRLSGDRNPLHVDPVMAEKAGFERPILHGLCTYGFAVRALLDGLADGDPARLARVDARFSGVVLPGDTLELIARPTAVDGTYRFDVEVAGRSVLSHGVVEIR